MERISVMKDPLIYHCKHIKDIELNLINTLETQVNAHMRIINPRDAKKIYRKKKDFDERHYELLRENGFGLGGGNLIMYKRMKLFSEAQLKHIERIGLLLVLSPNQTEYFLEKGFSLDALPVIYEKG